MKEQIIAPGKIQLSHKEIANLSDAQFKTLVIRMLTDVVEYGRKIEEKVNAMQSEVKKNMEQREEINIQTEQKEEIRIQKK